MNPDPIELFTLRAERAATIVHRCAGARRLAQLVARLAGAAPVAVSPTFAARYPTVVDLLSDAVDVRVPQVPTDAARVRIGVSVGEGWVVETGSVLVSEHALPDRLVSMLSPTLVQVVSEDAVFRTLDEVGTYLRHAAAAETGGYHALVTGPSRSADIERSLTIGVQGPAELHVVIFRSGRGDAASGPSA